MTYPVVESITSTAFPSLVTDHIVNLPALVASGNLLIVFYTNRGSRNFSAIPGWTVIYDIYDVAQTFCAARVSDGTEGGGTINIQVDSTGTVGCATVYQISGWGGTIATDIDYNEFGDSSNSPNPPALTYPWGTADTLCLAIAHAVDDDETVTDYPTDFTDGNYVIAGGGTNLGATLGIAQKNDSSGSDNPGSFDLSGSESWVAVTMGIETGSSGGTPVPYSAFLPQVIIS